MFSQSSTTIERQLQDEYLGFEIRRQAEEKWVAVPTFKHDAHLELVAATMPLLRKRIWQWWHMTEVCSN